jgi:hypothetical protein
VPRTLHWLPRLLLLSGVLSCAPQWADRARLTSDDAGAGRADAAGRPSIDPPPGTILNADAAPPELDAADESRLPVDAASADARAADRPVDRAPDRAPDTGAGQPPPPDAGREVAPRDTAPEPPARRAALLVVGSAAAPTAGDGQLLRTLAAAGLRVQLASDTDPVDVRGIDLVVLAASCLSSNLGGRYRDLPLPIVITEPAVFDDMGMAGPGEGIDWAETTGTQVSIDIAGHPLAAGLSGLVAVVTAPATLTWARPAGGAQLVASFPGFPDRGVIFGYPARAPMAMGPAPARRVGLFAADLAAAQLTEAGVALLAASIGWALK